MTPPRVVPVSLREQPESIDESRVDEILEALALLVREALLAAVRLRIGQVEFGVRDVRSPQNMTGLRASSCLQ